MDLHALYNFITSIPNLSPLNAILLLVVAWFARHKVMTLICELTIARKRIREHEATFLKHGMEIEREPDDV